MTPKHAASGLLGLLLLSACSAEYHAGRGREALDQHDLSAAEKHFRKALDKEPALPDALSGLGWTYQIAGKRESARDTFQRCLELHPEDVACLRGLASTLQSEGNPVQAVELLSRALQLAPEDPGVQGSMAIQEMVQGNLDQAAARYASLVERFPNMAEYQLGYAEVLLRQKKAEEALAMVDRALQLEDTPVRFTSMLYMLRARALVAATSGRVNPRDCANTAPPVLGWLDAAEAALADAKATGVGSDVAQVQRLVARRRGAVEDRCPGLGATASGGGLPALGQPMPSTLAPPPIQRAAPEAAPGAEPAPEAEDPGE